MNKFYISLSLLILGFMGHAQINGLEKIIVEKYYVSDANDMANTTGGVVPVGSTTYRIYVDMLPGYIFQAAYGVPAHELRIATSSSFFNNEDQGGTTPRYSKTKARGNTIMLDSWLSVGAACADFFGVLKSEDDGVATVINKDGILKNNDPEAGIPLTLQDGLLDGSPEDVTMVGITSQVSVFDDITSGGLFSTYDGSWASLNGSVGPDTLQNKVLIAQMTTDGKFSFELNIQIRSANFEVEQYVARNPTGNERSIESLIYPLITGSENVVSDKLLMNIYPNPAEDLLTIEIPKPNRSSNNIYSIFDSKGSLLTQNKLEETSGKILQSIDISKLPKGLFFLVVSLDGVNASKKIVKY